MRFKMQNTYPWSVSCTPSASATWDRG
jgi:DNA ligase (NAD+)